MEEEKIKWNARYRQNKMPNNPSDLLISFVEKIPKGLVLDIACGNGRNIKFLAQKGFVCRGLDISDEALKTIKHPNITTHCLDLDDYQLLHQYDVILNFYFLDRRILQQVPYAIKSGGMFLLETFIEDREYCGNIDSRKILKQGELEIIFSDFTILHQTQKWINRDNFNEKAKVVSFVAQKC